MNSKKQFQKDRKNFEKILKSNNPHNWVVGMNDYKEAIYCLKKPSEIPFHCDFYPAQEPPVIVCENHRYHYFNENHYATCVAMEFGCICHLTDDVRIDRSRLCKAGISLFLTGAIAGAIILGLKLTPKA